jgi:hypothetical protein
MIEEIETTYGLRHKSGKFARLDEDRTGIHGSECYLTMDTHYPIFKAAMIHDVMRLSEHEIHEWGTSKTDPSNRHIWKNISDFEIVAFRAHRIYDIEGGDPISTTETVERPILRYIKGHEPQGLMFDRELTPAIPRFKNHRALYKNDTSDRSPFFEEIYLVADRVPEAGMFFKTRQNNTWEVLASERVMNPFEGPTFAILFNANPNFLHVPEMEPYLPTDPAIEYDESGIRI